MSKHKSTRVPKEIEKQLIAVNQWHIENELPRNKRRSKRNGACNPLSAWMHGAKGQGSKIIQVTEGKAYYPYKSNVDALRTLAGRIAKRYQITWFQYDALMRYLCDRYAGRETHFFFAGKQGIYGGTKIVGDCDKLVEMYYTSLSHMPLRSIIDPNVTNLVLMIQFEETFKKQFDKVSVWK